MFLIRFFGPADLADDYHQERAAAYVMDVLRNGNWICQYGAYGEITSKPPMFTWLAALANLPFGRASWFALLLPGALSTLALSALIFIAGRRYFGWMAGFFGAVVYLISPLGAKQIALARIDGLFALTVALTALAAFRAWEKKSGWLWFWLAAAAATLTKGPLGILLGAAGLLAVLWEKRPGPAASLSGSHVSGLAVFFLIAGGWFAAAYWQMGQPLLDVMLGRELLGHLVKEEKSGGWPLQQCYLPVLYFARSFLPWCLISFVGLWRVWKDPATGERERRFERFLFCWFVVGLLVFSLAAHQRPDLIFPLVPAGAWLAGRELARWLEKVRPMSLWPLTAAVAMIGLAIVGVKYHLLDRNNPRVVRTEGMQQLARLVREQEGDEFPLTHVDSPFAFQFYLNTKRPLVSRKEAAQLLQANAAAFVAVHDLAGLQKELGPDGPALHELARWPSAGEAYLHIVSNHPRLERTNHIAAPASNE